MAAARGTSAAELRTAIISPLQRLMSVGPVFVAAADPTTWMFTGGANDGISAEATQRFMANEIGAADVVTFGSLARARKPVQSLYAAAGSQPESSARWRDVLEPQGWGDELRAALRDRSGVWGFLCLHRFAGDRPFDAQDVARLSEVLPALTEAFRRTAAVGPPAIHPAAKGPGVILLRPDLSVAAVTGSAGELLDELSRDDPSYDVPLPIANLALRLLSEQAPQRLTMRTPSGRGVSLHAGLLDGDSAGGIAIVVEPPTPASMLPLFAATISLTPRETEIAAAILRGDSTRLAARQLGISELTAQTQMRSVFAKAGVHSRGELVARLLG